MSISRTVRAGRFPTLVLAVVLAGPPPARARQEVPRAPTAIEIVDARLLAPDPSADGTWLVQVEEVQNGTVPGSVLSVTGLGPEMVSLGAPSHRGQRLRLVLVEGPGASYRVLSAHASPEVDPALADPFPPALVAPEGRRGGRGGGPALAPRAAPTPTYEQQVVELVNQERWNNGQLPPYKQVAELHSSASLHSGNMANRDFFAHCDLDTKTSPGNRILATGYAANLVSENIAAGYADPTAVMAGWMASSGHRAAILSTSYREIGVGYFLQSTDQKTVRYDLNLDCVGDANPTNGPFFRYWTQNFGRRNSVYPVVIDREAASTTTATVDLYVYGAGWAQDMRFSNDGSTWSSWETYNPNKTWTLSGGAGTKTVYAEIRNGFSLQASDTIYFDTPCTGTTSVNVGNQTVTGTASWQACETVRALSGFTVGATGDVTFQAGQKVVLGDGFAVLAGGSFRAVIAYPP